jgi:hypothetical protein
MAILELEPPCIIKFELIPPSKPNFCNFVEFQVTKMSQNSIVSVNLLMSLKSLLITINTNLKGTNERRDYLLFNFDALSTHQSLILLFMSKGVMWGKV